ncbi:PKD domain-containing protein [Parapedobacter pyrenivorans]|uniref:PKD domain-containing protein n=1 Tax=Parapedobacter pyrenivorans TaxID=1305674 RepID=UPI00333E3FDA
MELKHYLTLCTLLICCATAHANGIDTVEAKIDVQFLGSQATFQAELPTLTGIPGGRQPFYTYLWDFGDGHFSTEETPTHQYVKPGDYEVTLYTVNNYDNGPRPKRPTRKINVDSAKTAPTPIASAAEKNFFNADGLFKLSKNANALPGQDMVVIAGINTAERGRVFLLTNEKIFGTEGFVYAGQTTYNDEVVTSFDDPKNLESLWATISSVTVTQSGSPDYGIREELDFMGSDAIDYFAELYGSYKTVTSYEVAGKNSAQFSLVNLDITPEMLTDTNATVTITGVFIPESGPARVHRLDVPIVTSHDPNKMSLKQSRLSYRLLSKRKELTYKVQFQNDGEGDAKNIRLEIKLPEVLDPTTFNLLNLYPEIDSCGIDGQGPCYQYNTKGPDTLVFHFKNIALPGSKAPDVHDKDSTQGFIRFTVCPKKKLPNRSFKGQTNIYFDKNEPITTNFATGRFRKGFSPIVFAGYSHFIQQPTESDKERVWKNGPMLGVGLAPIAPYRKLYWQVEVYANACRASETTTVYEPGVMEYTEPGTDRRQRYEYERYDRDVHSRFIQLRIVPLHLRYNFNSWVSAGVGALAETAINTKHTEERTYHLLATNGDIAARLPYSNERLAMSRLHIQPFADINFGRTYLGPVLGLRYVYGANQGQFGQLYAAWRL